MISLRFELISMMVRRFPLILLGLSLGILSFITLVLLRDFGSIFGIFGVDGIISDLIFFTMTLMISGMLVR
ncbi:hypothetical protein K493DRAFT_70040 [Basidiobolus meristosporus CBS 931.73]|uniref:Uncharacterized protein n=1 Tax=Basidiobolus meristosporus CBS 931.73 TaxID=1314790 RepID=A0A1Y1XU31_9FUNG|nr:hypothetical protein K493DRAFT_70040 [Basidiobolus meristosporus CBS 931.73]|eukprot:ORX89259.1 hypothetical protein K493DRAFT_70040 [Basidiobolus meristosporus CBS 931.73]